MAVANGDGSQQPDKNNPFSFKNYIKKKSDDSPLIKKHPKGKTKKKIEEEVPFPDFIQEMESKKDTNKKGTVFRLGVCITITCGSSAFEFTSVRRESIFI